MGSQISSHPLSSYSAVGRRFPRHSKRTAMHIDPEVLDGCPGYRAINVQTRSDGLTAYLVLAGKPSNIFGDDIEQLLLKVDYETSTISTTI